MDCAGRGRGVWDTRRPYARGCPRLWDADNYVTASVRLMDPWRRRLAFGLFAAFWVLIAVGASAKTGYNQSIDFVSSLASRGSQAPVWGLAAIVGVAVAHLLLVPQLRRVDSAVGICVLVSGIALLGVAAFRVQCPDAPYCVRADPADFADVVHRGAVLTYAIAMVVAMVRMGVIGLGQPRLRRLGIASLATSGLFVVALAFTQGPAPGFAQRIWIALGQVWLIVVAQVTAVSNEGESP